MVVDTLGLQLQSQTQGFPPPVSGPGPRGPARVRDSVGLVFRDKAVEAHRGDHTVSAPYGQAVNLGTVQFAVRSKPPNIETATLAIWGEEPTIDGLLAGLQVTRREETDILDVGYTTNDPLTAQTITNSTAKVFQALNLQWARERLRRRRKFLADQLAQTGSMLAKAQAEVSTFRGRQQLASSQQKLGPSSRRCSRSRPRRPSSRPISKRSRPGCSSASSGDHVERRGSSRAGDHSTDDGESEFRRGHGLCLRDAKAAERRWSLASLRYRSHRSHPGKRKG